MEYYIRISDDDVAIIRRALEMLAGREPNYADHARIIFEMLGELEPDVINDFTE